MSKGYDPSGNTTQDQVDLLQEGILVLLIGLVQGANGDKPFPLRVMDILKAAERARSTHIIRLKGDGLDPTELLFVSVEKRPPELATGGNDANELE